MPLEVEQAIGNRQPHGNFFAMASMAVFLVAMLLAGTSCSVKESQPERPFETIKARNEGVLDLEQRQFLWDVEHLAFVLEQKVFPTIKERLARGDVFNLRDYFSRDFFALVPDVPWRVSYHDDQIQIATRESAKQQKRIDGAKDFLYALHAYRQLFDEDASACHVSIGLVRLGPVNRDKFDGLWKSIWRIRLAGTYKSAPMELTMDLAVELEPLDDELPNRNHWIRSASLDHPRIARSPRALMAEVTAAWGIDDSRYHDNWRKEDPFRPNTGGVYVCDYDRDGRLDALVEDIAAGVVLYRGSPQGRLLDVTQQAGLSSLNDRPPAWVLSCWADFDGDGDEDLLSQNRLFENVGNGTFRDVTEKSNLLLTPAAGYALADYDLDGRVDLYVCHTSAYRVGQRQRAIVPWIDGGLGIDNVLWRNLGDWQFADVTAETGTGGSGESCFSAVWYDANKDLRPDLLAINEFGANVLFVNQPSGRFRAENVDPVFGGFSMGLTSGDFDNDGQTDVYVSNMYSKAGSRILANVDRSHYPAALYPKLVEATQGNKLYQGRPDGTFEVVAAGRHVPDIGWTYGASFVDFNNDGYLDLYATAGFKSEQRGKPDG